VTGERVTRSLQAGLTLTVDFGKPRTIVIPSEVLAMLSEEARRRVMDEVIEANQRFKVLVEELHWGKSVSVNKLSKCVNVPSATLRWWMKRKMNVKVRDNVTALQLANTKYAKRDFDGDDVEKLRLWFLVHTDGSVERDHQQVKVKLNTPDPYLALLFKEVFGKYGYVGVAPHRNDKGEYEWELWTLLPLKGYWWFLERRTPTPIDNDAKLYGALNITIDAEGSVCARNREGKRTTEFKVVLYNEKIYVVEPLYEALKHYGYKVRLYATPKGAATNYGRLSNDCHHIVVCAKTHVKRLLKNVKLVLPHKRLKALLIKHALREPSKPVYWSSIEPIYSEVEAVCKEMLRESKRILKSLYGSWRTLTEKYKQKRIAHTQYEEERSKLRDKAWRELEALKEKYDKAFGELEKRIEAYFRARKPLLTKHVFKSFKLLNGPP